MQLTPPRHDIKIDEGYYNDTIVLDLLNSKYQKIFKDFKDTCYQLGYIIEIDNPTCVYIKCSRRKEVMKEFIEYFINQGLKVTN